MEEEAPRAQSMLDICALGVLSFLWVCDVSPLLEHSWC
jgi:hypothetical protein